MKRALTVAVLILVALVTSGNTLGAARAAVLRVAMGAGCVDCHEDCPVGQHVAAEDGEFFGLPTV
jgi:hypothetical protein